MVDMVESVEGYAFDPMLLAQWETGGALEVVEYDDAYLETGLATTSEYRLFSEHELRQVPAGHSTGFSAAAWARRRTTSG